MMMNSYIPHTGEDRQQMLAKIGLPDMEQLFAEIPQALKLKRPLAIPQGLSEMAVAAAMKELAAANASAEDKICFLGGGVYDHYIPAAIPQLMLRQEFYTAYTPYQAEMSQGTLQSIFEFQSLIARLTGMDIANASVYDGATACAEAMFMAANATDRNEVIILGALNPQYTETCKTYARFREMKLRECPWDSKTGRCDLAALAAGISEDTAAVIVQSPNYFGVIEDLAKVSPLVKEKGALLIVAADPISLGLLKPAAEYGADIAVGEGQALGIPMSFGGPGLGYLACKNELLRKLPGRLVGETTDKEGRRGFVLTIQAREQHIRREKATSNICTNQALCALAAAMYMTFMGKEGMRETAELCLHKSRYLYNALIAGGRFTPVFTGPTFKEFVVRYQGDGVKFRQAMGEAGFLPGIVLTEEAGPELADCLLIAVTEKRTKAEMDAFVKKAGEI